jgi:hypothetical protein
MSAESPSSGKYNIQMGNVTQGQVVIGDYNTVSQKVGLTPLETEELRSLFDNLKGAVTAQADPDQRDEALANAAELERSIVAEQPDAGRARKALAWFRDNAPQLVGAVVSVVVNPLVGKVLEGAGQAVADQFRTLDQQKP